MDECYVVTHHADTAAVIQDIKSGLEQDGLSDLVQEIRVGDEGSGNGANGPRTVHRRPELASTDIYQRIRLAEPETSDGERFVAEVTDATGESARFDSAYGVRMITDIVPNPWIGREIVGTLLDGLLARGFNDEKLGRQAGYLV